MLEDPSYCHVVLLIGPPASGKSTLGERLAARFGWTHVDVGKEVRKLHAGSLHTAREFQAAALSVAGAALCSTVASQELCNAVLTPRSTAGSRATLLMNGFPRHLDGLESWADRWPCGRIATALVLEAPDDILRARAHARHRRGDRPDDCEAAFEERLLMYHERTSTVIANIDMSGQARFLDATAPMDWVEEAAASHFTKSVVFVCGFTSHPSVKGLCEGAAEQLEGLLHIRAGEELASQEEVVSSEAAVRLLDAAISRRAGPDVGVVVLEGFPRNSADAEAWRGGSTSSQAVAALHVGERAAGPCQGCSGSVRALRRICLVQCARVDAPRPELERELQSLLRQSQPLSVAVPFGAAKLLNDWMHAASCTCWWKSGFNAWEQYTRHISSTAPSSLDWHAHVLPRRSPPPEVWLVWLVHMLRTEDYTEECKQRTPAKRGRVGPLPPPANAHTVRTPPKDGPGSVPDWPQAWAAPPKFDTMSAAVAKAPLAFVDALISIHRAGLKQLGDPRSYRTPERGVLALLQALGLHYRRFLISLAQAGPRCCVEPPRELDWLWHAHIVHPQAYAADCRRLFGREIPHRPGAPPTGSKQGDQQLGLQLMKEVKASLQNALSSLPEQLGATSAQDTLLPGAVNGGTAGLSVQPGEAGENDDSEMDSATLALGCLLPGGDRLFLRDHLERAGMDVGAALAEASTSPTVRNAGHWKDRALRSDPTSVEVSVRTLGGEVVLQAKLPSGTTTRELREELARRGETQDLKLFFDGRELQDADGLAEHGVVSGSVINLVRVKKPPPRPASPPRRRSPSSPRCCSCFTVDCSAWLLSPDGSEELRAFPELREGDLVRTGARGAADRYRRVQRIWACPVSGFTETVALSERCRLTAGHPVLSEGRWRKPEELGARCQTLEDVVYTIELEGHVDTILLGGFVCAALGVYCGEDFGWNIFTRKTRRCDAQPCEKCRKAVIEDLDFSAVDESAMAVRYEPY